MDGKSGSFPFQVMTTATTLPDTAFYKINEKQNQIKINQLIMDLASNSLSIINQNIKIQLVDVKEVTGGVIARMDLKNTFLEEEGEGGYVLPYSVILLEHKTWVLGYLFRVLGV